MDKITRLTGLLMFVLAPFCGTLAQNNPTLQIADTLIHQGISLYDEQKYDLAIEKFKLVHPADSDYFLAQYELSLTYLSKKDYNKTIEISQKAISDGSTIPLQYNTWGTALDDMGKPEEALKVYDLGLAKFPYNTNLYFNKAVVYQQKGDMAKAKELLIQLLDFAPYHASSHLRIARFCKNDGLLAQAIMAYTMFLIIEPASDRTFDVLSELNKLCDGSLADIGSAKQKTFTQEFEEIDELITNQVALNEKFKVPSQYTFPIIKQVYLLIDRLNDENTKGQGFFAKFYAPFFMQLKETKSYETFSLLLLASSTNEKIAKQISKQIEPIRSVRNEYLANWRKLHSSYTLSVKGKLTETDKWFRSDLSLVAFGKENSKGENSANWVFINHHGYVDGLGQFENGNRTGVWTFFEATGDTMKILTYKNDKPDGKYKIYNKGLLDEEGFYKNGELDDTIKQYFPDGTLAGSLNFLNGKRHGQVMYYYTSGGLKTHLEYRNGEKNGIYKTYHESGALSDSSVNVANNYSGNYKEYYEDGKLARDFNYQNGVIEGDYKTYFRNGQLKSAGIATKGSVSGEWTYYYSDGKLKEKSTFDERGKITGNEEVYDHKGRKYKQATYLKGDLKKVTYFDVKGDVIYNFEATKKNTQLCEYNLNRFKIAEGPYKESKKEGTWKYYFASGALQSTQNYKNNELHGECTTYHKNGKIKEQYSFEEGNKNGFYKSFHANGALETEGNFKEDNRCGLWYNYFENGKLQSEIYYQDGVIIGDLNYYTLTGKPDTKQRYNTDGMLTGKFVYDTTGRVIDSILFKTGTTKFSLKGASGKKFVEGSYKHGQLHGPYQVYYPNGKLSLKGNYFAKYNNGEWINYYPNSKIANHGKYFHGERNGLWEYFDYFGTLTITNELLNGLDHGVKKWYYPDGKVESEIETYEDEKNNKSVYYANNGDIREIRYYELGLFVGYSYLNKNKEKVDTIFLKNGDGSIKAYYSNGNVSTEYTISNGSYHGTYKIYYPDGTLQEERLYDHGEEIGPTIEYFANGKIATKSNYCHGQLCGEKTEYNPNGTLRLRENYLGNELHGIAEYFDKTGKKTNAYSYYCGNLINVIL